MVEVNNDPCANGISVEKFFMNEITDDMMGNKKCQLIPAYKLHKVIGYSLVKDKENVAVSIWPETKQKRSINAKPANNKTNRQVLQVKNNNAVISSNKNALSKTSTKQQKRKRSLNSEPENENSQPSKVRKLKAGKTDTKVIHKNGPNAGRGKEDKNEDTKSLANKRSQRASSKSAGSTHQEIKSPERCRKRGCKPKTVNRENTDHPKVVEEGDKMLRVIDENCNLSMILRRRQSKPHLWRLCCSDSEDESWSPNFGKKGKKKAKRGGEKRAKEPAKEKKPVKNQCSSKTNKDIKSNDKVRMEQTGKRTSKPKKNQENLQEKKIHGAQHKSVQKKEVVHKKPEECEITAKRGTLKYLKQRKEYVKALAKEAECEDDFFAEKDFDKHMQIGKLLSLDNFSNLTIKTPNNKGNSPDDGALTPRTNLLGQWGVNKECFLAYTPPAQSPEVLDETEKEGVIETIFHQLRDQKKRSQVRKSTEKKPYESVLMNPHKTSALELPELPTDPDLDKDESGSDDYFEVSECY
ncbi:transcriptional regulator ATRX homolog isoform X2 [Macrobrachium nipponense]